MTDLTIPPDADERRAAELVQSHVEIGDTVEIRNAERTEDHQLDVTGEVTGFEPEYVELDGQSLDDKGVRYDEIHTVSRIES
ncbi:hypothetical protein [Natrinema sp. 1APR25-10V2]|uniref:hypothetical protein n=1 Tax=Natrinema sp. 1APR25-10V2 TaxID=2951081 RepID=UPI00287538DB|nr:hypothetical protein [Natrinema sp. 1APR25-10V2]MDS0474982.1 hypothetical protein [Natrinema sp. 1APR25-10V2]